MMPQQVIDTTDKLITQMAEALSATDLQDEGLAMRTLLRAGFSMADIVLLSDQAVICARTRQAGQ